MKAELVTIDGNSVFKRADGFSELRVMFENGSVVPVVFSMADRLPVAEIELGAIGRMLLDCGYEPVEGRSEPVKSMVEQAIYRARKGAT
jgi:hypothetical protein